MIKDIIMPNIKTVSADDRQGVFVIEPFYPGYGTTIGNALRRVLLTSLPGAAVSAVYLKGVTHEFMAVEGVKEDAVTIMLNLKGIRMKFFDNEPQELTIKVDKKGEIKAKDIQCPSSVEIVNPDHHIMTVTDAKDGVEMRLRVESGRGYRSSEEFNISELPTGWIVLDSIFSPAQKVSFNVENTRVGDVINYDKLTLEIETDETMTPLDALKMSAQILIDQLGVFLGEMSSEEEEEKPVVHKKTSTSDYTVEELNLSVRTLNALQNNKIKNIAEIKKIGYKDLAELKGIGARAVNEIKDKLAELGINTEE